MQASIPSYIQSPCFRVRCSLKDKLIAESTGKALKGEKGGDSKSAVAETTRGKALPQRAQDLLSSRIPTQSLFGFCAQDNTLPYSSSSTLEGVYNGYNHPVFFSPGA